MPEVKSKSVAYRQEESQDFNQYHTEMKRLSSDCELGTLRDELLGDMLIIGLTDKRIQEGLLRESNLTLAKVVTVCQTVETTRKQAKTMQKGKTPEVDVNIDNVQKQPPKE